MCPGRSRRPSSRAGPLTVTLGPSSAYRLGSVTEVCVEIENSNGVVQHPCANAPPLLLRSLVVPADGNSVELTFNQPIPPDGRSDPEAFTVTVGGVEVQAHRPVWSADFRTVALQVSPTIRQNRQVKVRYARPRYHPLQGTGGLLKDTDGNDVREFNLEATNNSTVSPSDSGLGPQVTGAQVWPGGTQMTVHYDERLGAMGGDANRRHGRRFSVNVDGVRVTPADNVEISNDDDNGLVLDLFSAIKTGQTVTLGYADPSGNDGAGTVIQDPSGNDAPSFTDVPVRNGSRQRPGAPPVLLEAGKDPGDSGVVALRFSKEINLDRLPPRSAYRVTVNGSSASVVSVYALLDSGGKSDSQSTGA